MALYDRITDKNLLVRRVTVAANRVLPEDKVPRAAASGEQMDLFSAVEEQANAPVPIKKRVSANGGGRRPFFPSSSATATTPF